jgi:hypothetical protein
MIQKWLSRSLQTAEITDIFRKQTVSQNFYNSDL